MKNTKRVISAALAAVMTLSTVLTGCGGKTADTESQNAEAVGDNYIDLALNVYYNDGDHDYYANEAGESLRITEDGTYTLSFDCAKDLSEDATAADVSSLTNLTAVYLLDMGVADNAQSPLKACNIMYDSVKVDDTELTITQTEPKSAFKSSGIFDTNDPINAWDGSQVEEVEATSDHVANFTSVENPTSISITFTLSDMNWDTAAASSDVSGEANTYVNKAVFSDMDFTDMTALELTQYLGNGINLGNTMEAYGKANLGTDASVDSYETYWGQPVTTEEMVAGMKNCGFDTLRIPVAWTNMMDYENGDYTIDTAYLDRVEEIVNYALDNEMFVVLNDHWDGCWWGMFGSETQATREEAMELYTSMWTQIAERFADYSDMLIFESANEELGRSLNDNTVCEDSGSLSEDECYETTNRINQTFVDTIRATGGNNDDRFLLIAGYNTDIDNTVDDRFEMPTDTASSKLFLSVHYYTPWNYCGSESDAEWGTRKEYAEMSDQLNKMTKYTDQGYGIIIGEYSAIPLYDQETETHTMKSNTLEFNEAFLDYCEQLNMCPVLWSTNDMYNKATCNMIDSTITDLFTSHCYYEQSQDTDAFAAKIQEELDALLAAAPESRNESGAEGYMPGEPVAWIMWNGGAGTYSVGDTYNPDDNTEGITAHDVVIDGAGEYTVSLDFAGGNTGLTFAALGIADCEDLYPGAIIDIKEIDIDGKAMTLIADPYTSSDDDHCTRVNLLNEWVKELPEDARNLSGDLSNASPVIIDKTQLTNVKTISITFEVVLP